MTKPNYLDLLNKRVEANARLTTRITVYLDPEAAAALDEAHQMLAAERVRNVDDTTRVKMNGSVLEKLTARVAELEQAVRDSTLMVVVQALSDTQELEAAALKDDANQAAFLRRRLELGFVRATDVDGNTVPDVGLPQWSAILGVTAPGELAFWSQKLNRAGQALNFPTSAKS